MGGSDRGRGEPVTPHKTRRSLPSQASGKLRTNKSRETERKTGMKEWEEKRFLKTPKNQEKVFPF